MPSPSVASYRVLVEDDFAKLKKKWIDKLKGDLATVARMDADLNYWAILEQLAWLNWEQNDPFISAGIREGLEQYKEEMDAIRESPPSAAYLEKNKEGDFLIWEFETGTPTPQQLVQKHREIISAKRRVLTTIARFFGAVKGALQPRDDNHTAPDDIIKRLSTLSGSLDSLSERITKQTVILNKALDMPTSDWPDAQALQVLGGTELSRHVAVTQLINLVETERSRRKNLETQLGILLGVAEDDSSATIKNALHAIAVLTKADPDQSKYKMFYPAVNGRVRGYISINMPWVDRTIELRPANLAEMKSLLEDIETEQTRLDQFKSQVIQQLKSIGGDVLTVPSPNDQIEAFWQQVELRKAYQPKALWDFVVEYRTPELSSCFGKDNNDNLLYELEAARREAKFEDARDIATRLLRRDAIQQLSADDRNNPAKRNLWLHDMLQRTDLLSLGMLSDALGELLGNGIYTKIQPGSLPTTRNTLSRGSHNLLADMRRIYLRLSTVKAWISKFKECEPWWSEQYDRLEERYLRAKGVEAKQTFHREMMDIAPDYTIRRFGRNTYQPKPPPCE